MSGRISAADEKLNAARYHLSQMNRAQDQRLQRHELAAFLGAARSVVLKLRDENKAQHAWVTAWTNRLPGDEQRLWRFMTDERNADVHEDGTTAQDTIEQRPVFRQMSSGANNPLNAQNFVWGWFDQPWSYIGVPTLGFEIGGVQLPALDVCQGYLTLVERFLADFKVAFSVTGNAGCLNV